MTWATWDKVFDDEFDADEDMGCVPKLYVADSGSGNVELSYLGHIQRTSLMSEASEGLRNYFWGVIWDFCG